MTATRSMELPRIAAVNSPQPNLTLPALSRGPEPNVLHLDRFHILRSIGEGGMGSVYLAYDAIEQQRVAIKFLADDLAKEKLNVDRFNREARVGASLDHPHIVRTLLYGRDRESGRYAMVLEYVDGPSCQYLLDRDGKLSVDDAVLIVYHITQALAHMHEHRVIHRDVKPDNILLSSEGLAKLSDFGLSKRRGGPDDLTANTGGLGTSWYMPFEQAKSAEFADERSDIFSLGATFYHMLTGSVPFPGTSHAEIVARKQADRFEPVSVANKSLPPALDPILRKMLALDPRQRYASAKELIVDIEKSQLLNGYRTSVALGPEERPATRSSHGATTYPDLGTVGGDTPLHDVPWHLRFHDGEARTFTRLATTRQVLAGLNAGLWPDGVEAARSERRQFRPLIEYPEFRPILTGEKADTIAPPIESPSRRSKKLFIVAGFGVGLLIAAAVASLIRGFFIG
jgi:eukaryotic-like serine/threonine-protein kinase